ncbi:conserved exported protein of unknown function [Tenacibaculum sp. 190524A02b]|uniref:Outer membrane protein beta-barrel domain-containing protein n=1 Tax=Tenacibaculum vairaonense TaxID=3137860 RepID=A0ABP1FGX8_9FLAO
MYKYFISICLLLISLNTFGQKAKSKTIKKDTITYKTGYGIRVGIDLSKPTLSFIEKSYRGLEIIGDYRIAKNWYIASELGYEKETSVEDFTTSTATGSYIRIGANFNAYKNWLDMNNEIFIGGRYGLAIFDHSLDSYTPNVTTGVNNTPPYFPTTEINEPRTETGLNAHWAEIQLGIKVETFKNLFLGASFAYKIGINIQDQTNFKTLYVPGFNRVFENGTGFGFNYTISYLIPFVNK